jgi:acyl-CoA thioesterase YciA
MCHIWVGKKMKVDSATGSGGVERGAATAELLFSHMGPKCVSSRPARAVRIVGDGRLRVILGIMAEAVRLPEGKEPVLRVMPMPADANHHGDIFGGWIMSQVDIAGGVLAGQHARGRVATVAVNAFQFKQPVQIGDLVSFYAEIVRVGNTSITVNVEVYAQRNPEDIEIVKVTEATLTYVATDKNRRPRTVLPLPAKK